jgi:hypothetical protein
VAASEDGLGDDWLNNAFTGYTKSAGMTWSWFDEKDSDIPITIHAGQGLRVELASAEMMLALKTVASRQKDLGDIYLLMRETNIRTPQELGHNLARFTGRRIFDEQGAPGMYLHIDPTFRFIFENAPDDLKPPEKLKRGLLSRLFNRR